MKKIETFIFLKMVSSLFSFIFVSDEIWIDWNPLSAAILTSELKLIDSNVPPKRYSVKNSSRSFQITKENKAWQNNSAK